MIFTTVRLFAFDLLVSVTQLQKLTGRDGQVEDCIRSSVTMPHILENKAQNGVEIGGGSPGRRRSSVAVHRQKLGTVPGVFVPVFLSIMSILMFLRFGVILGQIGFIGMLGEHF